MLAQIIALVIGVFGIAGVIFTALKYNRDDTTAVVTQQSQILGDMKQLNDEWRATAELLRVERDELRTQVEGLRGQVEALRVELRAANAKLTGKVTAIQERLEDADG